MNQNTKDESRIYLKEGSGQSLHIYTLGSDIYFHLIDDSMVVEQLVLPIIEKAKLRKTLIRYIKKDMF
jgi:hypothetical protein